MEREQSSARPNKNPSFAALLWLASILLFFLGIAFALYVFSEKQIDKAGDLRYLSYLLADELRQSSDDLTRMVRNYVVTGDSRYKKYYQDIADIRDGKKPRPEHYQRIYWDFILANEPPPDPEAGEAVPLMELLRRAGFTQEEFQKLAESKSNSDQLIQTEFEAMKLAETHGPAAEEEHERARSMLYDENYHQAKADIMHPIDDFLAVADQRMESAVDAAKKKAAVLRVIFLLLCLVFVVMLFRIEKFLRTILGGSVDQVYRYISRIGRGDFSSSIQIDPKNKDSVLAKLVEMQKSLKNHDAERRNSEEALRRSEAKYRGLFENSRDAIMMLDPPSWKFSSGNLATIEMFRLKDEQEFISLAPWDLSPERQPDGSLSAGKAKSMIELAVKEGFCFFNWIHQRRNGETFQASVLLTRIGTGPEAFVLATVRDISQEKELEETLKQKVEELERFNRLAVGRELTMIELKQKLKALESKQGPRG